MYANRVSPGPDEEEGHGREPFQTLPPRDSEVSRTQVSDQYDFNYVDNGNGSSHPGQQRQPSPVQHASQRRQPTPEVRPTYKDKDIESAPQPVAAAKPRPVLEGKDKITIIGAGETEEGGRCAACIVFFVWIISIIFFPITLCISLKVVAEYERAVIFRLGRLKQGGAVGPGMFCALPCVDTFLKVDLRTVSFDVPPQEILTRDSVTVSVDAVVYFRVSDPVISIANVADATRSTQLLAATTLRNILGQHNLTEVLSEREQISNMFQDQLDGATGDWGIDVERVEIKDVRLPVQLQRAMAAEAEATREAKAKVIQAEGEQKASRALKEAADVISSTPSALQLRYLQTLGTISAEKNSTIVFPFPIEMLKGFKTK